MSDEYDYESILGSASNESANPLDNLFNGADIFGSVDMDSLPDNPFELPANTYRWRITGVEMKMSETKKLGLILKYAVASGSYINRMATEWLRIPYPGEEIEEAMRIQALANLNLHLKAFGLSSAQIMGFNHRNCNQLLGSEFWGTTVNVVNRQDPSRKDIKFTKILNLEAEGVASENAYDPFKSNGPGF